MKKLVCIALFSIAIMANATEKKRVIVNNSKEIVTNTKEKMKNEVNNFKDVMFFGCGSEGNAWYSHLRMEGKSHRDARKARRAYVRRCRNYFWQFGIF